MTNLDTLILMTSDRISRSLKRMAHEINERNRSDFPIVLFGINRRGLALAEELGTILSTILDGPVNIEQLNLEEKSQPDLRLENDVYETPSFIVLVDDVIFSGRTMFRALTATAGQLKPAEIYTAVLVDRGHRKYPVRAEFYGLKLPTKLDEHVDVVVEGGNVKNVRLTHQP